MGHPSGVFSSKPEGFRFFAEGLPLLVFFGFISLIFWKTLFSGGSVISPYLFTVNHPWAEFLRRNMANGDFPMWNPHIYSGLPFFSDPKSAMLYPLSYIFAFLPYTSALFYSLALHTALAAFFTYAFCRMIYVAPSGAIAAAFLFGFGGTMTLSALEINKMWAMTWLPLTLIFANESQERSSLFLAFCAALSCVAAFFAGSPSVALFTALAAAIYWLWLGKLSAIPKIGAFCLSCVLLSAVLLLPALSRHSMLELGHRAGWTLPHSITFKEAARMVFFPLWSFYSAVPATAFFCGWTGLVLAFLGLRNWKSPWMPFAIIASGGLLFSFGGNIPFFESAMRLPMVNWVGDPSSALCMSAFGVAVLAGLGIDYIFVRPLRALLAFICLLECAIFAIKAVPHAPHGTYEATSPAVEFLAERGPQRNKSVSLLPDGALERGEYQHMTEAAAYSSMSRNYLSADGPVFIPPPFHYTPALSGARSPQGGKWLSILGVAFAAGRENRPPDFSPVEGAPETILGNPRALPRFRFAKTMLCADDSTAAKKLEEASQDDLLQFAYSGEDCNSGPLLNYRDPAASVEIVSHTSDSYTVSVKTPFSGYLIVNENWDKGWHASVNRRKAKILRVDLYQKGVEVPAGESEVSFSYTPPFLWLGATISLLSLFGLGATLLMSGISDDYDRPSYARRGSGLNLDVLSINSGARRTKWGRS